MKARYDYLPFGEETPANIGGRGGVTGYGGADSTRQKFTQKERDSESGLDYFGTRYYSSAQGRFTSHDPLGPWAMSEEEKAAFLTTPQQWNRYAYVSNNPLKYSDPDGLEQYDRSVTKEEQERIHQGLINISANPMSYGFTQTYTYDALNICDQSNSFCDERKLFCRKRILYCHQVVWFCHRSKLFYFENILFF